MPGKLSPTSPCLSSFLSASASFGSVTTKESSFSGPGTERPWNRSTRPALVPGDAGEAENTDRYSSSSEEMEDRGDSEASEEGVAIMSEDSMPIIVYCLVENVSMFDGRWN